MTAAEISVYNARQNAVKAAGHVFPPRASTTVEVDEEQAGAIAATRGLEVVPSGRDDALALRRALVARAKELGLPATGKNADLVEAINAADAAAAAAGRPADEQTATAGEPGTGDVTAGDPSTEASTAG